MTTLPNPYTLLPLSPAFLMEAMLFQKPATIPEITLDNDDDAEEDEAYGSGSTTRSSTLSSSSSYFQRSSQSKSPGSASIKTSSTKTATATKSSCRRQGLARSVKKSSGPQQRSVRDMFPIKQSN
ncbi:hypothetical protein Ocin01_13158 [Orchesella cincta]|uniref:Uncharacterized protein n=1 Tax=Orchesella cincta TaxID=48709 RepID=A0A1D2MKY7_ORCCI|nr:hypothetical protein Ocin01_13158 [Orchesella cincta]